MISLSVKIYLFKSNLTVQFWNICALCTDVSLWLVQEIAMYKQHRFNKFPELGQANADSGRLGSHRPQKNWDNPQQSNVWVYNLAYMVRESTG